MPSPWPGLDVPIRDATMHVRPLTPDRWPALEELFGPNGAQSGCWCMYWRRPGREWSDNDENRRLFHDRVDAGPPPGLIGFVDDRPVGWVQIGPRPELVRLQRSRTLGPVDEAPVWALTCFYVDRRTRRGGVAKGLLRAALDFARAHGATVVEAYPVDREGAASGEVYTGVPSMFVAAGFTEVARRHPSRPIVRLAL